MVGIDLYSLLHDGYGEADYRAQGRKRYFRFYRILVWIIPVRDFEKIDNPIPLWSLP
jgi:hypothetical protein